MAATAVVMVVVVVVIMVVVVMVGTITTTTRRNKHGAAPREPVSAMLPRLCKLFFPHSPPSAHSSQIRPHPVTVGHRVSLFVRLPSSLLLLR